MNDLLKFEKVNDEYADVVNNHVHDLWVKLLTTCVITKAFYNGNVEIISRALWLRNWLRGTHSVTTYDEHCRPYEVRVENKWLLQGPLQIYIEVEVFNYEQAFIENTHEAIDKLLLSLEPNLIDSKTTLGYTALSYAILKDDYKRTKFLIESGCSLKKIRNVPYLSLVSERKRPEEVEIVSLLLAKGIDVNEEGMHGRTAIFNADEFSLPIILSHPNVNINHVDSYGLTAITHRKRSGLPTEALEQLQKNP